MKKNSYIIIVIVIGLAVSAMAYTTLDFPGWPLLIQSSSDIIVARCIETPSSYPTDKNEVEHDLRGLIDSNINIVSTLKGTQDSKTGQLTSEHQLFQNEYYLIFARSNNGSYQAFEPYRIIPLGLNFSTNSIIGKPLDEQLQILFQHSIDHLNREIQKDQEEKARLEEGLQK